MVHPCRTENPGTTMHACNAEFSTRTLCGLAVDVPTINKVWGFKKLCSGCYPVENPVQGPGDELQIPGRDELLNEDSEPTTPDAEA